MRNIVPESLVEYSGQQIEAAVVAPAEQLVAIASGEGVLTAHLRHHRAAATVSPRFKDEISELAAFRRLRKLRDPVARMGRIKATAIIARRTRGAILNRNVLDRLPIRLAYARCNQVITRRTVLFFQGFKCPLLRLGERARVSILR
jgi:hypothetical protein